MIKISLKLFKFRLVDQEGIYFKDNSIFRSGFPVCSAEHTGLCYIVRG